MKKIIIILLILVGVVNSYAQVNTKTFEKNKAFENYPKFKISLKKSPVLKMPKFDIALMLEEDDAVSGMDVPFRFGKGFDVNYTLKDGHWENANNGRVWSLLFQSEGAYSINFIFSELLLPEGGELYMYNTDGTMVYGPVTSKQNLKKGTFLTDLVQGDAVTIHIFEPEKAKDKTSLTISRVVHAYKDTYSSFSSGLKSATLSCYNNVDCYSDWEDESDGVALILLSNGDEWCTGGLVNNTANDYTPYFLTAFHCLNGTQASWMFKFGFRDFDCGGMNYTATTYNGADYISGWNSEKHKFQFLSEVLL
jgi:hypothetical protein